jgi:hypothetical protein
MHFVGTEQVGHASGIEAGLGFGRTDEQRRKIGPTRVDGNFFDRNIGIQQVSAGGIYFGRADAATAKH